MSIVRVNIKSEETSCDLCKSNRNLVYLDNVSSWEHEGNFKYVKCLNCKLIFLNPRPIPKFIEYYYPDEKYWGWDTFKITKRESVSLFAPIYNLIFSIFKKGRLLDIGTGSGLFLTGFANTKWKVCGTEISKFAVKIASKSYNLNVRKGDFINLRYRDSSFDVITLNNVLEHLYSPKETLLKANKVLRKGGIIIITVPNINSLGFVIFRKNWHALQPPRHLFQFSHETLEQLLSETGFQVEGKIRNYKKHIIYSLFESFRFNFSPKFNKGKNGGLIQPNYKWTGIYRKLLRTLGLILANVFANIIYIIELISNTPEVITFYARKK